MVQFLIFWIFIVAFSNVFGNVDFGTQNQETFVAIRITDKQVKSQVKFIQKMLVHLDQRFSPTLTPINSLHLAFNFYNISGDNIDFAKKALTISAESYVWHFGDLSLDFKGILTTNDNTRLIFGLTPESFSKIDAFYGIMAEAFKEHGLKPLDQKFDPQITIAILHPSESAVLKSKLKILVDPEFDFGKQQVKKLDLCSKFIDKKTDYFAILAEAEFSR